MSSDASSPALESDSRSPVGLLRVLFAIAILATCGWIMAMNQADPDLWGHLQYGKEVLSEGRLPSTATWTFTAIGFPWINHENIAELATAATFLHFGNLGLTLGKYLLGLVLIGLIYWSGRRQNVSPLLMGFLCLVVALASEFHWHFRPQVFGYVLFAVLLVVLRNGIPRVTVEQPGKSVSGWNWGVLWLIPLMVIWANTHGSFVAGLAVLLATVGLRIIELLAVRWKTGRRIGPLLGLGASLCVGATLATCVTPYGHRLNVWLWETILLPTVEIGDWQPLALFSGSREALCFWTMLLTWLVAQWRDRQRDWVQIIVFLLVAWQAVSHVRHLPLLALVWSIDSAASLDRLRRVFWESLPRESVARNRSGNSARRFLPVGASALLLAAWIGSMGVLTWPKLTRLNVETSRYPVRALEFMARNRLEGRTLVTFNWAQYAIGVFDHTGMKSTVAVDGRYRTCYPQEILDRYFDFLLGDGPQTDRYRSPRSGAIDPQRALRADAPELVLISRRQRPSVRVMEAQQDNWTILYQDALAQVWGRRDLFDRETSRRYFPSDHREIGETASIGFVSFPAYPPAGERRASAASSSPSRR